MRSIDLSCFVLSVSDSFDYSINTKLKNGEVSERFR